MCRQIYRCYIHAGISHLIRMRAYCTHRSKDGPLLLQSLQQVWNWNACIHKHAVICPAIRIATVTHTTSIILIYGCSITRLAKIHMLYGCTITRLAKIYMLYGYSITRLTKIHMLYGYSIARLSTTPTYCRLCPRTPSGLQKVHGHILCVRDAVMRA